MILSSGSRLGGIEVEAATTYLEQGDVLRKEGKWEEARECYQKVIELEPNNWLAHHHLGDCSLSLELYEEAAQYYKRSLKLNTDFVWSHYNIGIAQGRIGNWDNAFESFHTVSKLQPDFWRLNQLDFQVQQDLGDYLFEQQRWQDALVAYRRVIELQPSFAWSYINLGRTLLEIGQLEEAVTALEKAVEVAPDLSWGHYYLKELSLKIEKDNKNISGSFISNQPKLAVISWDMSHNPIGRAFLLADMVKQSFDVELIGPIFPLYGKEIWSPIKDSEINMSTFTAHSFKEFVNWANELAKNKKYDYVYVGKPRFPSLLMGMLIKHYSQCPFLLDVDDHELSFFKKMEKASLEELMQQAGSDEWLKPYSEIWTRFSENLIPLADSLTVSNVALQQRYGGVIVRHARNEAIFNPKLYDRQKLREEFNYNNTDKVILFLGTPRPHKGIFKIADALEKINDPKIALCIIGTINDKRVSNKFSTYKKARIDCHDNQPWERLPELVYMADLVCILQDSNSPISEYQIPAKLTDAIAMNVPVLVSQVPPFQDLIAGKHLIAVEDNNLELAIRDTLNLQDKLARSQHQTRRTFLTEFSYSVNAERIKCALDLAKEEIKPWPQLFSDVFQLLRDQLGIDLPVPKGQVSLAVNENPVFTPTEKTFLSPKNQPLNIIFFWKQNDSDIYGRRQDMIVKYLAENQHVNKIIHFDAPISVQQLEKQVQHGDKAKFHQGNLVFTNTVERFLGLKDTPKVIKRTFIYREGHINRSFLGRTLPPKTDYVNFVKNVIKMSDLDENTIAWVCPVCFDFPELAEELKFKFIVADIIDDQRKWDVKPQYAARLEENYQLILKNADCVLTNCEPVRQSFSQLNSNITVIPNGSEVFDHSINWSKPTEIAKLEGPIIGYVGNLSDRIDVDLLKYIAQEKPDWNIVIIGSAHGDAEIFELETLDNVYLLGVRKYEQALKYIANFDVAIIPHLNNKLTKSMNPLKLYVYYSMGVPIVTSDLPNIDDLSKYIYTASNHQEFLKYINQALGENCKVESDQHGKILKSIDWRSRSQDIIDKINENINELVDLGNFQKNWKNLMDDSSNLANNLNNQEKTPSTDLNRLDSIAKRTENSNPIVTYKSDDYEGICSVCGTKQVFTKENSSFREGYRCNQCKSSLRYRGQADAILYKYSKHGSTSIQDLCKEHEFKSLSIYEPGVIGSFRDYFMSLKNYTISFYWPDVKLGEYRDGLQCQNLEKLTYQSNRFDLIITSDILEHIRNPWDAFKEIWRVLKPGGHHIFTIPVHHPIRSKTFYRVDTSGKEDIYLVEPRYHSAPNHDGKGRGKSLVYVDFGKDMIEKLYDIGLETEVLSPQNGDHESSRLVTLISRKI